MKAVYQFEAAKRENVGGGTARVSGGGRTPTVESVLGRCQ